VLGRNELSFGERPLKKVVWGGAVETVGGTMRAGVTQSVRCWGNIASIGLAGGTVCAPL